MVPAGGDGGGGVQTMPTGTILVGADSCATDGAPAGAATGASTLVWPIPPTQTPSSRSCRRHRWIDAVDTPWRAATASSPPAPLNASVTIANRSASVRRRGFSAPIPFCPSIPASASLARGSAFPAHARPTIQPIPSSGRTLTQEEPEGAAPLLAQDGQEHRPRGSGRAARNRRIRDPSRRSRRAPAPAGPGCSRRASYRR